MMRMLRILHVFVPLLFVAHPMAAMDNQSGVSVQGTIREETTSEIIPFVNVVLVDLPDSIQRGGTVTNNQGVFVIPDVKPGSYFLVVSFIGYEQLVVAPFVHSRFHYRPASWNDIHNWSWLLVPFLLHNR